MQTGPGPLIKLTIEGVRGIAEFACAPDGNDLILAGDNGTGKSSATASLAWALGEDVDGEIVHNGSDEATVDLRWRAKDGSVLEIHRSKGKNAPARLTVKAGKETKAKPATLLAGERGAVGRRTFSTLPAAEQVAIIKSLAPDLDTSDLDQRRATLYEERTEIGHRGKALGEAGDARPELSASEIGEEREIADVVDVAEIAARKAPMERQRARNDAERARAKQTRTEASTAHTASAKADRAVEEARATLARLEREAEAARTKSDGLATEAAEMEQVIAALVDLDPSALDAEITAGREANAKARSETEAHNRAVRERKQRAADIARHNAERARKIAAIEAEREKYAAHTKAIEKLDKEKLARVASAARALPVAGLAISGGIVTIDDGEHGPVEARVGVLNDGACMELDVRMAAAQKHRIVVLPNAERLGKAARARINALTKEHGIQAVYEVRTDGAKLRAEVIEDAPPTETMTREETAARAESHGDGDLKG